MNYHLDINRLLYSALPIIYTKRPKSLIPIFLMILAFGLLCYFVMFSKDAGLSIWVLGIGINSLFVYNDYIIYHYLLEKNEKPTIFHIPMDRIKAGFQKRILLGSIVTVVPPVLFCVVWSLWPISSINTLFYGMAYFVVISAVMTGGVVFSSMKMTTLFIQYNPSLPENTIPTLYKEIRETLIENLLKEK